MSDDADILEYDPRQAAAELAAFERRLRRNMLVAVALAVTVSALCAPWRVTTGLLLGGALALFNYHWLSTSVAAIIGRAARPDEPQSVSPARYILRYFIIGLVVGAAALLDLVSLPATIGGLTALVAAIMWESLTEFYFTFAKEEI